MVDAGDGAGVAGAAVAGFDDGDGGEAGQPLADGAGRRQEHPAFDDDAGVLPDGGFDDVDDVRGPIGEEGGEGGGAGAGEVAHDDLEVALPTAGG
jgi:hypothetical protein